MLVLLKWSGDGSRKKPVFGGGFSNQKRRKKQTVETIFAMDTKDGTKESLDVIFSENLGGRKIGRDDVQKPEPCLLGV